MTAALLRCAADVIEKCAFDASDYRTIWGGTSGDEEIANTFSGHAGGSYEAEWIALMHPGIATPLVAWLRVEAESYDAVTAYVEHIGKTNDPGMTAQTEYRHRHPLALARAILREDR